MTEKIERGKSPFLQAHLIRTLDWHACWYFFVCQAIHTCLSDPLFDAIKAFPALVYFTYPVFHKCQFLNFWQNTSCSLNTSFAIHRDAVYRSSSTAAN